MDTNNASPQFKVGDRVTCHARNAFLGAVGTVAAIHADRTYYPIEVHTTHGRSYFCNDELKPIAPAPPLGVEPWRLLFRAHRDGWRLLNSYQHAGNGTRHRQYLNPQGLVFTLDTKRPVR